MNKQAEKPLTNDGVYKIINDGLSKTLDSTKARLTKAKAKAKKLKKENKALKEENKVLKEIIRQFNLEYKPDCKLVEENLRGLSETDVLRQRVNELETKYAKAKRNTIGFSAEKEGDDLHNV